MSQSGRYDNIISLQIMIMKNNTIVIQEANPETVIRDEDQKQVYLYLVSDQYSRKIMDSIMDIPKAILEISNETKIPLRTVYRKIQMLYDSKMLKISGSMTDDGKKYFLYKSKIRSISVRYSKENCIVSIKNNIV